MLSKADDDLSRGGISQYPDLQRLLGRYRDIASRWAVLGKLCQRCEALAKKELEEKAFDGADNSFLINFGEVLADIMFHISVHSGESRDNAPESSMWFPIPHPAATWRWVSGAHGGSIFCIRGREVRYSVAGRLCPTTSSCIQQDSTILNGGNYWTPPKRRAYRGGYRRFPPQILGDKNDARVRSRHPSEGPSRSRGLDRPAGIGSNSGVGCLGQRYESGVGWLVYTLLRRNSASFAAS